MPVVPVNSTKVEDKPAAKKESQSMENQIQEKLQTLKKIRPELNLEKWSIWQPAKSKNPPKERILKREITLPDGNKVAAKVEIGFTNKGALTTEDQKVFYGFIKIWEDAGKPTKSVCFSLRKLAKILRKKWGTNVIDSISNSCLRLRITPFIWEHSFFDNETKETIEILDTFNILSELKIIKRKKDGVVNKELGYFIFNIFILKNLLANHTKPLFFEMILEFKSEIAQLIYGYIDLIMADKIRYERRTKELFEDLNLEGKAYKNLSDRKRVLEKALKELQGVFLSTGVITHAQLELTKDEKDYKVVFVKQPFSKTEAPTNGVGERQEQEQPLTLPQPDPQTLELAKYFHQKLGRPNYTPSSKELDQGASLLAECGLEKCKHIINFAVSEAETTNFKMQTFGALFQYKSEALRLYEKHKRDKELQKEWEDRREKQEQEKRLKAGQEQAELDALYFTLTEPQKQTLETLITASIKVKPFTQNLSPSLCEAFKVGEKHNLLRELKANSRLLDLVPTDPASAPQDQATDLDSMSINSPAGAGYEPPMSTLTISPETPVLLLPARTSAGIPETSPRSPETSSPTQDPFLS